MSNRAERLGRVLVEAVGPHFCRAANGETVHFFSEDYCREILADWLVLDLTHLRLGDNAGTIFKYVWRCIAQKPIRT
jgi:hypothetical protein